MPGKIHISIHQMKKSFGIPGDKPYPNGNVILVDWLIHHCPLFLIPQCLVGGHLLEGGAVQQVHVPLHCFIWLQDKEGLQSQNSPCESSVLQIHQSNKGGPGGK